MRIPARIRLVAERGQPQPNRYTCGPAALRAALLRLGIVREMRALVRAARTHERKETDEGQMRDAARASGCNLVARGTRGCSRAAAAWLAETCLAVDRADHALVVPVDRDSAGPWSHWIAVVGATKRDVWVFDPAKDSPLGRCSWNELFARAGVPHAPDDISIYLYEVEEIDG